MRLTLNSNVKIKPAEDIMVGYLAASVVENDCWKEEVVFASDLLCKTYGHTAGVGFMHGTYKDAKAISEKEFKQKNNLKQMPGKYRSAKSVIVKALANDIELLDADGFPRGKSDVEKELRNVISKVPAVTVMGVYNGVSINELLKDAVKTLVDLYPVADTVTREAVRKDLKSIGLA